MKFLVTSTLCVLGVFAIYEIGTDRSLPELQEGSLSDNAKESPVPVPADKSEKLLLAETDCNPRVRVCEE